MVTFLHNQCHHWHLVVGYALAAIRSHSELAPVRLCPCRANKQRAAYHHDTLLFVCSICVKRSDCCRGNPVVNAGKDTEEGDACGAECESQLSIDIALKRRQRRGGLLNIHGLDNEQVVVE